MLNMERTTGDYADETRTNWLPDDLSPDDQAEIRRLADKLSPEDPAQVIRFGADIQEEIAAFTATVLDQVRASDAGEVGEMMTELIVRIRQVSPTGGEQDRHQRLLSSIPAVARLLNRVRRSAVNSRSVEEQVEEVRAKLDEAYFVLQNDIELLEQVLSRNHAYFRKLELHISAVQQRLQVTQEQEIPALQRKVEEGVDPWAFHKLADMNAFVQRLEMRLDDFRRTRFLSLSQAPKIRLLQQGVQIMMEKIQSVMYNLIPVWKMDLITSIAEQRAVRALTLHEKVRNSIEEGLKQSAERTRELTVGIAAASERGVIGSDTLRNVHHALLGALEDTIRIHAEGREQRLEAERELQAMEQELRMKVAELAGRHA